MPAEAQVRAALTRDMDSVARGTRQVELVTFNLDLGSFSTSVSVTPAIPAGKRLLVQKVSAHTLLTDGQSIMEFSMRVTSGGSAIARFWVDQNFQAAGTSQRHFTGNLDVDILLNSGESLNFFIFRNDNLGSNTLNFGNITVLGYLVDITP
jgi:hypothetical protein